MEKFLELLSAFFETPASAFVVPFVVISYFIIEHKYEKRTLRQSRAVFADGWDPAKGTEYKHKWWPGRRCSMCFTSNSPNDKFVPSVVINIAGIGVREMNANKFRSRYKEIV